MSWDHIAKYYSTAEMIGTPTQYQKFKITSDSSQILKGAVVVLFFYNLPVFDEVYLELWSDDNGSISRKIAESDSYTDAECNTSNFAHRTMGFTFPGIALNPDTYYYLTVRADAYTGDETSHIAWRQSWPDPQYPTGITLTLEYGLKFPFDLSLITADL